MGRIAQADDTARNGRHRRSGQPRQIVMGDHAVGERKRHAREHQPLRPLLGAERERRVLQHAHLACHEARLAGGAGAGLAGCRVIDARAQCRRQDRLALGYLDRAAQGRYAYVVRQGALPSDAPPGCLDILVME